jgi:hypothetical protein
VTCPSRNRPSDLHHRLPKHHLSFLSHIWPRHVRQDYRRFQALYSSPLYDSHCGLADLIPKYPVVLIHGFADNPKILPFWRATETELAFKGVDRLTVKMPPYGSLEERSTSLVEQIRAKYDGKTVHLIAHSMVRLLVLCRNLSDCHLGRIKRTRYCDQESG